MREQRRLVLALIAAVIGFSVQSTHAQQTCPCSVYTLTTAAGPNSNDTGAVELGVKFQADSNGFLTGLRFYKYAQNTGSHVGSLWSTGGALLGTLTFNNETASGWQQASFPSPVAITAGTTYVASYHSNTGFYAVTNNGLTAAVDNAPLHFLSNAAGGGNGVYQYSASSAFPNQTFASSNYWVDVVFATSLPPDTTPPTVTTVVPAANATGVSTTTAVTVTFSEGMSAASITGSTVTLRNTSTNTLVGATVTSNGATATLTPAAALAGNTTFAALVTGGASGVKDLAGNPLAADFAWSFTTASAPTCPCSIWTLTTSPGPNSNDTSAVELGTKFRADSSGFLTGLRFYKYAQNTGTHVGSLWTTGGTLLGTLTFGSETASGWQQASFPSPIAITAGTTYVASYHSNTGFYAVTNNGLTAGVDNGPLHILSDAAGGGNGVYRYGAASAFPNQTFGASNYWVDVVFATSLAPDTTPPTVTTVAPAANATGVSTATAVTVTFSEAMSAASITGSTVTLRNTSTNILVGATVTANGATATLTPTAALAANTTFAAVVTGGSSGVKDAAGNPLAANFTWSFTTAAPPTCPCSIWTLTTSPGPNSNDVGGVELGVKFRADNNGFLTGLRFYKYAQNTGTHVGSLWTTSGTLLGTLTFGSETASGWQQASFPSPIAITAGTTYVASYHTNTGFYAVTNNGFSAGVDNGPLHILSDAVAVGNGVYRYGSASAFPNQTFGASNYWVDVVYALNTAPDTTPPTVSSVTPAANATNVSTTTAVSVTFSEAMSAASITASTITLRNTSTNTLVGATVSLSGATATLTPTAALAGNTTFAALVTGGANGVKDTAGNPLAADFGWSFTTSTPPTCPCSIWTLATSPGPNSSDTNAVEVGLKFRADSDGFLTGLRFYKYAQNTGTHIGSLWTTSGTLLGTLTFGSETASGWQQASFPTPIAITAGTTYVASYHSNTGFYAVTNNGLSAGVDTGPLHALSDAVAAGNGVYRYGAGSVFPNQTFGASNYWIDVVFSLTAGQDTTPPTVTTVTPANGAAGIVRSTSVRATFSEPMDPTTISTSTFTLRLPNNSLVSGSVVYNGGTATLTPAAQLAYSTTYTALVKGGTTGVKDLAGNALAADFAWSFTIAPPPVSPTDGAGGPILVVADPGNPFTRYYAEVLRAEGLNEFAVSNLSAVTSTVLASYDVVILGQQTLTPAQVTMLTNWVSGGGNLIAMRPDKQLAGLLGLSDAGGTLANTYLAVDASQAPAAGIESQALQFHGTADQYVTAGATVVATLYSDATHATAFPAVSLKTGVSGAGSTAAFTYDLARSIVYTRQGNPAWTGQERDGQAPIRSDDLFFGAKSGDIQPDWVDHSKVAIPQADEQQRLLANLIVLMNSNRKPLPRLWYFPRGFKAVVVMTGDDHASGGTVGRFNQYASQSPNGCVVDNWECIRSTSFIYPALGITDAQVASFTNLGFDISLHLTLDPSTQFGCGPDFTATSLANAYTTQLGQFRTNFPSAPAVATHRMHCLTWSDWSTQAQTELLNGIRFDTTFYYWPGPWVANTPGLFTGSGMPMRYAAIDGSMIDVYQATSQMTDESSQVYPFTINTLLDNALGPTAYYGAFTANMHTDSANSAGSDAIVASAVARGVPIVSARQMLTWVDGRNASTFGPMTWSGNALGFSILPGAGATGLQVMIPTQVGALHLTGITLNGTPATSTTQTIKGVQYAFVTVKVGQYQATYAP